MNKLINIKVTIERYLVNNNVKFLFFFFFVDLLDKTIANFEMKCASLFKQLQSNQQEIKDCIEAGDMLSNDMNSLATQLQSTNISQNWPNFEVNHMLD